MDTSDTTLQFDERGRCEYCNNYYANIEPNWHPDERGVQEITPLIEQIKREGKDRDHDCIIGISGGLDSSYVTYVAKEKYGLRPLMFHCDTGWNSDIGVSNIQKIIEALHLDLVTEVVNWEEMKDLQRAFFKSQVPCTDTPQDLALFSAMYNFCAKNGFKYVITGGNISTEVVRESLEWTYYSTDLRMIRIKKDAIRELNEKFGWQPYPQKHYESRFTRFYESYWTPKKFGFDKRRAYFSSEVLTGQMTRDEALERLSKPELDEETMAREFEYVATKLGWTVAEFEEIFRGENKSFRDYKNINFILNAGAKASNLLGLDNRIFR
jgi:hypothetical protein